MAEANLEIEFHAAVLESGPGYLTARKAILESGTGALAFLDSQRASGNWKVALTADILTAWVRTPKVFEQCTDAVQGNFVGPVPITGNFPPKRRISEIRRLGKPAALCLLEMAWKTREYGGQPERETIFGGLAVLKDERSVVPLADLMKTSLDEGIRSWAASTLGALKDPRAVHPLLEVLEGKSFPAELRAAAAMSLGTMGAKQAVRELREIAANESADLELRMSAARALGDLGDSASAEMLLGVLGHPHDLAFELVVLQAVGKAGGASILPKLVEIGKGHGEAAVREAAKDAAGEIEERSQAKRE